MTQTGKFAVMVGALLLVIGGVLLFTPVSEQYPGGSRIDCGTVFAKKPPEASRGAAEVCHAANVWAGRAGLAIGAMASGVVLVVLGATIFREKTRSAPGV